MRTEQNVFSQFIFFRKVCWEDEEMNSEIKLQRNSVRSFQVGNVLVMLGQAGKGLFVMKSTLLVFIPSLCGVPKGMVGRIEGIQTICPWFGVGGRDRMNLFTWEKALRNWCLFYS